MDDPLHGIHPATIDSFWLWFAAHTVQLMRDASEDDKLPDSLAELDRRVQQLHAHLTWEMGPHEDNLYFALSPGGHPQWLPLTRALVQAAPSLAGWHFLPAKPAKSWNRSLTFEGTLIDASRGRYALTFPSPGRGALHLALPDTYGLSPAQLDQVARIVVESEVGEETRLTRIARLTLVREDHWTHGPRSQPLYRLWEELHDSPGETNTSD